MMLVVTTKDETDAERIYAGQLLSIDQDKITLIWRGKQKILDRKRVHDAINVNGMAMSLWKAA